MAGGTVGVALVFALILVALVLLVTEPVSIDVTDIGIVVTLVVLGPWTAVARPASETRGRSGRVGTRYSRRGELLLELILELDVAGVIAIPGNRDERDDDAETL